MNKHPLSSELDSEQQTALGDLRPLEGALQRYTTPDPDSTQLLVNLQAVLAQEQGVVPLPVAKAWRYRLRLAQMQISLVDSAFWWVSALLLGLGTALVLASGGVLAGLFALVSPLLAVAGTAYIFRPEAHSLREFELLSAVSPLELLYTRLLLILLYNIGLALTLILLAWSQDTQLVLWRLLLIWLGPMIGLTGVALYSLLRWRVLVGVLLPMGLWAALLVLGWRDVVLHSGHLPASIEVLSLTVMQSNTFLVVSVLTLVIGAVLMWRAGHWTAYEAVE
jgi:hypothetical protein